MAFRDYLRGLQNLTPFPRAKTVDESLSELDYLLGDPNPQYVPQEWIDMLNATTASEDQDFTMPWYDEEEDVD